MVLQQVESRSHVIGQVGALPQQQEGVVWLGSQPLLEHLEEEPQKDHVLLVRLLQLPAVEILRCFGRCLVDHLAFVRLGHHAVWPRQRVLLRKDLIGFAVAQGQQGLSCQASLHPPHAAEQGQFGLLLLD